MQLEDYTTGTVSISKGSATLTGAGTAWSVAGFKAGDTFHAQGLVGIIASVDSDTAITLRDVWMGEAISGGAYLLRYQPDNSRMQGTTRELLDQLRQGIWLTPDATGKTADKTSYDDRPKGFRFLDVGVDPFKLYVKETDTSGDWSSGADWVGPAGNNGTPGSAAVVGTSTTSLAIAIGSNTFAIVEPDRGWGVGARLRASSDADGSDFMEGVVTAYADDSLTLSVDRVGGSGTAADWTINLTGEPTLGGREVLTANRTYYVSKTGSDANNGLTAGAAFLTVQKAVNVALALDMSIYSVTISVSAGTFAEGTRLYVAGNGNARIMIQGAGYDQTTISGLAYAAQAVGGVALTFKDIDLLGVWDAAPASMTICAPVSRGRSRDLSPHRRGHPG